MHRPEWFIRLEHAAKHARSTLVKPNVFEVQAKRAQEEMAKWPEGFRETVQLEGNAKVPA